MTRYRKFIAAVVGAFTVAVTQGLISAPLSKWVAIVVAALTAAGVYQVSNNP